MLDASLFFAGSIFLFKNERINFWHQNHRRWGQVPKQKIKSELCISAWHFMAASLALAQFD
jgi:hypothetical protein